MDKRWFRGLRMMGGISILLSLVGVLSWWVTLGVILGCCVLGMVDELRKI